MIQNWFKSFFETHVHHFVGFVKYQHLKVIGFKPICFFQVLEKSTWSTDEDIHIVNSFLFIIDIFSSDDQSYTDLNIGCKGIENLENLHGEFTNWDDDNGTKPIHWDKLVSIELFDQWH